MRLHLFCTTLLVVIPTVYVAADEPKAKAVEFDTKLSFSCRDVTPKDFASANKDRKIVEVSLRISANFAVEEKTLESIVYKLRLPSGVEIADYLPKTALASDIAGPIETQQKASTRTGMMVSFEGGAKVSYRLPAVVDAEANVSGKRTDEKANEVSSGVQVRLLPPKQLILAAGTESRGQTLYFKLRPFSQITPEGEKEFACLLVVPKDWTGDCVTLDCTALVNEVTIQQTIGVGLYVSGDAEARTRVEKLARGVVSTAQQTSAKKEPSITTPAPIPSVPVTLSCEKCAGTYKIVLPSVLGSTATNTLELKKDGTWEGTYEVFDILTNTMTRRGTWSIQDGKLTIAQMELKSSHSFRGFVKNEKSLFKDVKIKEFDEKHKTIYLESGEVLRP